VAQRAYWKGHIRLSLVSFPVRLYPAVTGTEKIALHQYHKKTGERIHYQKITDSGIEAEPDDIIKGYEYEKGHFVSIDDRDMEKLRLESKHTIDLVQFVDSEEVDPIYFEHSYFVAPDGEIAQEAFLTVREALKYTHKAAIGQIVLGSKERIVLLRPCRKGLILNTLRYAYEVRNAETYFEDIPLKAQLNEEQLELAELLIEKKSAPFDPKAFKDHYQQGLMEIIEAKLHGKSFRKVEDRGKPSNVVNIVDALKQSLRQAESTKSEPSKGKPPPRTRKTGRNRN
jgi:DNA end-binding protein Ku